MTTAVVPPSVPETGRAVACLPYRPESDLAARDLVHRTLTEWGLPELAGRAQRIVSELVTNAVKTGCHREMAVEVTLTGPDVRIAVTDGSRALPVMVEDSGRSGGRRGLALVHHLTGHRWGVTLLPKGKTVHADLRVKRDVP